MIIHETEHLQVDCLDRVWMNGHENTGNDERPLFLHYLVEGMEWPPGLGPEPNWWITEVAELFDKWNDGSRYARDCRETADEAYRRAKE